MTKRPRKGTPHRETAEIAALRPGGKLANIAEPRRDFVTLRKQGRMPVKMSMAHAKVFKALWQIWLSKRVAKVVNLSSSVGEVSERLGLGDVATRAALESLVSSGVVRQTEGFVGRIQRRVFYTPLPAGIEILALAEHLGEGAQVQVGKRAADWVRAEEPPHLFDFAKLLRGGGL